MSQQSLNMQTFEPFKYLPTELRRAIWRFTWVPRDVVIMVYALNHFQDCRWRPKAPLPASGYVCRESRDETLRYYKRCFESRVTRRHTFFNYEINNLFVLITRRLLVHELVSIDTEEDEDDEDDEDDKVKEYDEHEEHEESDEYDEGDEDDEDEDNGEDEDDEDENEEDDGEDDDYIPIPLRPFVPELHYPVHGHMPDFNLPDEREVPTVADLLEACFPRLKIITLPEPIARSDEWFAEHGKPGLVQQQAFKGKGVSSTLSDTQADVRPIMSNEKARRDFTSGTATTLKEEGVQTAESFGSGERPGLMVAQMELDQEVVGAMITTVIRITLPSTYMRQTAMGKWYTCKTVKRATKAAALAVQELGSHQNTPCRGD
ncbi:hypothetical protein F4780DRAFT_781249 [Xylariomycetidae sp. FL0641]|nr:hypothetical protein F4780DRAFT_781249 [Xylariomycetidae sp. FL0641]